MATTVSSRFTEKIVTAKAVALGHSPPAQLAAANFGVPSVNKEVIEGRPDTKEDIQEQEP